MVLLQTAIEAFARQIVVDAGGTCDRSVVMDRLWAALGGGPFGREDIEELLDEVLYERPRALASFPGDGVADVATVAENIVLTHRLSEAEVATGTVDLSPDLALLASLARVDGGLHAGDGSRLRLRERRNHGGRAGAMFLTTHFDGPTGWLEGFAHRRLVAARAAGGFLVLEPISDEDLAGPPVNLAEELGALMDSLNEGDGFPVAAEELQVAAAVNYGWFSVPRPPFGQLAEAAGFELEGQLVGRRGCWEQHRALSELVTTVARHDMPEAETSVLLDAVKAFDAWRSDPGHRPSASLGERVRTHWTVAYPILDELRRKGAQPDDVGGFAVALGGPAGSWLASRAAALAGDAEEAERRATAALAADPSFGPSVAEAAWYASDRGRARDAVNLLHRVRAHHDAELVSLRRLAAASAPAVGRNERCPCGSGRKYKACHLGRSALPEAERVRWLLAKVTQYVMEMAPPELLDDVTLGDDSGAAAVGLDLLAFDEGWVERFVADRASLLPEVEREWAEQWSAHHVGSVFRVERRHPDGRLEIHDARTGIPYTVEPSSELDDVASGRLVWARLVPVQDRWWTTGVVRHVALAERSTLLAATVHGTPVARRLEALSPHHEGPRLQNTSGHPAVLCTTVVAFDAPAVVDRLDAALERDGAEPAWHTRADTGAMERAVTAQFRLGDDGRLTIESNSLERRDMALALLTGLVGPVDVISETRVPIERAQALHATEAVMAAARRTLGLASNDEDEDETDDDDDPTGYPDEVAAALAEVMEAHEERWIDQPVPALGGRTPRQAAADEGFRADLMTLLAEMEDLGSGFDAERVRSRLGVLFA